MNLYNLHSNPEQLHGYSIKEYRIPEFAYSLAKTHPELRPNLEPTIMKSPRYAYAYSWHVLKRPWAEAEPVIMKDPKTAYHYALHVLKRRWPEAEPYIMKDKIWWNSYKREFYL